MDLPPREIHLWCARPEELSDERARRAAIDLLSEDELQRLQRFRVDPPRLQFLAGRAMLRRVLSGYDSRSPAAWELEIGPHGRPVITGDNPLSLQFTLSKSSGLVVCAITRESTIGIDVENIRRRAPLDVADSFFAPVEAADLRSLPADRQPDRFFEYWTLKESYIKARGLGLSIPLDQFAFHLEPSHPPQIEIDPRQQDDATAWQFAQLRPTADHVVALALRCPQPVADNVHLDWHTLPTSD